MGYYLDFVFAEEDVSLGQIADRFCEAGATIFDRIEEEPGLTEREKSYWRQVTCLNYPGISEFITIFHTPPKKPAGCRAEIRLSWGHDQQQFTALMDILLYLAAKTGCRIYDGQTDEFVTRDTLSLTIKAYRNTAESVIKCFGRTNPHIS